MSDQARGGDGTVRVSFFERFVLFFSRKKKKRTYFIDWQIYDDEGRFIKWANSVVTSDESPHAVYADCMSGILKDLVGTGANRARAVAFNEI